MTKKNIFILILILLLLIVTITFLFLYKPIKKQNIKIHKANRTTIKTEGFRLQQTFNNKNNKLIFTAEKGELFKETDKAKCYKSKAKFIKNKKKIAQLNAPEAHFYFKKNKIKMRGGIKSKILNDSASNNRIY